MNRNTRIPRHQQQTGLDRFLFGVPYYPEHWSQSDRLQDVDRMKAADVNVVRMAEFAWDRIEPNRGKLDFSLFDETIDRLGRAGIATILCTPTATPPRWLTAEHPEWMRIDSQGRAMEHGSRQHACTTSEGYRAESRRITQAMATHYAGNDYVIGWQTDNEFYCHFSGCYCEDCVAAFREWLGSKYGTAEALNSAWGTAFWAQTYDDFSQVPLPYPQGCPAVPNPSHELDYYRVLSDMLVEFQRQQVEILRRSNGRWWVMHNGLFRHIDYWKLADDLDFLGVDIYPGFAGPMPNSAFWAAGTAQRCRAHTGGFIVPEQQGGAGGQKGYLHDAIAPGQMRLWAYQSIAHGADGVMHFRWRTCRYGAEIYWNGILDHDNKPRRRYEEFAREGAELERIGGRILGTVQDVRAAVLIEEDQTEAHGTMPLGLPSPEDQAARALYELWERHLPCGYVHAADSFEGLHLLVLPSFPLMDEDLAGRLREFVERGGVLVVTPRSATRDRNNHVTADTPPGLLAELCGVQVEEFGHISESGLTMHLQEQAIPAGEAYEILTPTHAAAAATWVEFPDGRPCAASKHPSMTIHHAGKGTVVYVGTYLTPENAGKIMGFALTLTDLQPLADCEDLVEVTRRISTDRALTFVLNHYGQPKVVSNLPNGCDLLTGKACDGRLQLEPYAVAIIEEK